MKTELRIADHSQVAGAKVFEIWHNGKLIGQVTGSDNFPGVRVISKYPMAVADRPGFPHLIDVKMSCTFTGFTAIQVAEMRTAVARGAGHECSEWSENGQCLLCDAKTAVSDG